MKSSTFFFSFFFTFLLFSSINGFKPSDSILLNCGSPNNAVDADGRAWSGESSLTDKILTSANSTSATALFQDPSLPSPVPYMTARVFIANATYNFPVSKTGRHWIRLYFYPASYNNLNPDDAFFSVTTLDGLTFLKNFSAALTAKALTQAYIIKEFSVASSADGILSLVFSPDTNHRNSYAFVNGIEIISMPDVFSEPVNMVGYSDQTIEVGVSAMQTLYRLNVGGQYIPATNDSELSRIWYDDSPYLYGAALGVTTSADKGLKIEYPSSLPEYIAPVSVYQTARSMGPDPEINKNFNLTWVFQVDGNFTYVVRLHFCEIVMQKVNQRVFDIYLNNQTAETAADVIAWTSTEGVPIYKDYAVFVSDTDGDDELWVALHPNVAARPEYMNSILNGLEVFKMSTNDGNLAGPNPEPSSMMMEDELDSPASFAGKSSKKATVIGGAAGGAAAAGLFFAVCIVVYRRKRKVERAGSDGASGWLPLYGNSHTSASKSTISGRSNASSHLSSLAAAGLCRHFSLPEIKQGTRNFDESLVIGVGGFGKVYKGVVDGSTKVAIKRSNPQSEQGVHEFQTEIEMLSKLRHKHLVSLIGYCEEDDEMILVYDYMAYGTLREHLYKTNKPSLSWKQRLEICIGAARGLHYLHTGAKYTIIHRDVKTTNILLDDNFVAKVSDFGLSKTGPMMNQTHVSTVVKGSFGYLDPEYFRRQQLTDKSDVYSFGVVLFEVLCARPALNPSLSKEQVSLADWAMSNQRKETAEKCLSDSGVERPTMGDVLWNLEFALQLQEAADSGKPVDMDVSEKPTGSGHGRKGSHTLSGSIGAGSEVSGESDESSNEVFSQLVHPRGR
ncbi:Non-specific serine/threonine protein kinase protein [Dioscorea alata]|uniref:Non-specific serine/threonine protein kinase protein n=1 Tax=Dioscorea alata TaxID=55571 RepID=A0ACB7VPL4_DIOAL|nr:Non-specific serine/threonine protein kinase protein [Dioscorea alata]